MSTLFSPDHFLIGIQSLLAMRGCAWLPSEPARYAGRRTGEIVTRCHEGAYRSIGGEVRTVNSIGLAG